jgi:hypothetical protein
MLYMPPFGIQAIALQTASSQRLLLPAVAARDHRDARCTERLEITEVGRCFPRAITVVMVVLVHCCNTCVLQHM